MPENPLAGATFVRLTDFESSEYDAAISPDGRFVAFASERDGPLDIFVTQVGTGQFSNLTNGKNSLKGTGPVRNVTFSGDGSEIMFGAGPTDRLRRMTLSGGAPRPFLNDQTVSVAWSPDGSRLVYHTAGGGDAMFVADRTGANAQQIFIDPIAGMHNHYPAWSPDGQWIYFARGSYTVDETDLWRIPSSGGQPERLTHHESYVGYPAPLDRRTLLYVARGEDGSGPWLWALDVQRKVTSRVSLGVEQYLSVAASADGHRIVATVANPTASLWSVPILDSVATERDVKPFVLPTMRALAPRFGPASLFYLSSRGAGEGLWRYSEGQAVEIWKSTDGAVFAPPAISPDGRKIALVLKREGQLRLHIMSADGAEIQPLSESINVQGTACWSPDGKWIVAGGADTTGPGLFKIPVAGGQPVRIVNGAATHPVWSPSGGLIVYTGAVIAAVGPLLGVQPDGAPVRLPEIKLFTNGERVRFLPDGRGLIYMQGSLRSQDFELLDLATMKTRTLTRLDKRDDTRTFDITADGKQIVFDRLRDNSDIVLIDLPARH
jgi:Tol biopolymer transport system component